MPFQNSTRDKSVTDVVPPLPQHQGPHRRHLTAKLPQLPLPFRVIGYARPRDFKGQHRAGREGGEAANFSLGCFCNYEPHHITPAYLFCN